MDEFGAPVRGRRIAAAATIIALLGAGLSASGAIPAHAATGSTISGTVWQDNDGVKDTFEKGMADVQVQAVAGDVRSDGVTTDDDGNYTNGTTMVRGDSPNEPHTALAAAYMRRHAGFGPAGIGGIYAIRPRLAERGTWGRHALVW